MPKMHLNKYVWRPGSVYLSAAMRPTSEVREGRGGIYFDKGTVGKERRGEGTERERKGIPQDQSE